jgi:hypothetical protein
VCWIAAGRPDSEQNTRYSMAERNTAKSTGSEIGLDSGSA